MPTDSAGLRARLDAFQFEPSFVHKLARENGWSLSRARVACVEYKRFVFLALAAGHPCAPSDAVDQVWHQHLLHTEDYWGHFCPHVLGAPLHHQPGGSSAGDGDKFRAWYRDTLRSYERCFDAAPPAAWWPAPERYLDGDYRRIDRRGVWLLRKPRWPRRVRLAWLRQRSPRRALALAATSLAVAGCSLIHQVPPFDMRGPSFLLFFAAAWALSLVIVVVMRGMTRGTVEPGDVHAYELAYLVDGDWQVVQAVSAALVQSGRVQIAPTRNLVALPTALRDTPSGPFAALETAVLQACLSAGEHGVAPTELLPEVAGRRAVLTVGLESKGLLFSLAQRRLHMGLALLAPALGAVKIGVGLSAGKPVGFLVLLSALAAFVAWYWLRGERQITPTGKALIADLRQHTAERPSTLLADQPVAMSVALFGASVLADSAFSELERSLAIANPARRAQATWGSGGGSSDNSWSSSNSSSDWSSSSDSSSSSSSSDSGSSCSSGSSGCGGCSSSSSSSD